MGHCTCGGGIEGAGGLCGRGRQYARRACVRRGRWALLFSVWEGGQGVLWCDGAWEWLMAVL